VSVSSSLLDPHAAATRANATSAAISQIFRCMNEPFLIVWSVEMLDPTLGTLSKVVERHRAGS
jgi:hypothetical protein